MDRRRCGFADPRITGLTNVLGKQTLPGSSRTLKSTERQMPNRLFSSRLAHKVVLIFLLAGSVVAIRADAATCTGADPCKACKNWKYCKHRAKGGGKCGICK